MIVYMIFLHTIIAPKERNFVLVGVGVRLKRFFEPTFLDNKLWFNAVPHLGPLSYFFGPFGVFFGSVGDIFGFEFRFKINV